MKDIKVANTYSKLLFKKAVEEKLDLDALAKMLCSIKDIINHSQMLGAFLNSAIIDYDKKIDVIDGILKSLKAKGLFLRFIKIIIKNNQTDLIEDIYSDFYSRLSESNGVTRADITFSSDLTNSELEKCVRSFETKLGKKFDVNKIIDPSIGGGVILQYGSNIYDLSVKSLYQKLNR